jgi:hypothetical protein
MSVIGMASAKGSPGVSTAALALMAAWPADASLLVCDLDPAGGDLATWLELDATPNLSTLAAESRHLLDTDGLLAHAHQVSEGVRLVAGAQTPEEATVALELLARAGLGRTFRALGVEHHVLLDLGRLEGRSPANGLLSQLDELLVVLRPTWSQVRHVANRLGSWSSETPVNLLLVGDGPYRSGEVSDALGRPVVGVLAEDSTAAGALSGSRVLTRSFERSRLWRSARVLAETLALTAVASQLSSAETGAVA